MKSGLHNAALCLASLFLVHGVSHGQPATETAKPVFDAEFSKQHSFT